MSLLEEYRLFTGHYVYESDIPSEDKLALIRFLKEATGDEIVDILSGEYGVQGLTEADMELVNDILEGKLKVAKQAILKRKDAIKAGAAKMKERGVKGNLSAAGKKVKDVTGWSKVGRQKALRKGGTGEPVRYKKAVRSAIARTAAVPAGAGVAGGGYYGYKKSKK